MSQTNAPTAEQVLLQRLGVSIDDAVAVGTDFVDAQIEAWSASGISTDQRLRDLAQLLQKLTQPATLESLNNLIDHLPHLTRLISLAGELPNIVAALADTFDEYQRRAVESGIDLQKSLANGLHAACWLSSQIDQRDLETIGSMLKSEVFGSQAVDVVSRLANSISRAHQEAGPSVGEQKIGLLGLLNALRNPQVQRSLAFAVRAARCFGENLESRPDVRPLAAEPTLVSRTATLENQKRVNKP